MLIVMSINPLEYHHSLSDFLINCLFVTDCGEVLTSIGMDTSKNETVWYFNGTVKGQMHHQKDLGSK